MVLGLYVGVNSQTDLDRGVSHDAEVIRGIIVFLEHIDSYESLISTNLFQRCCNGPCRLSG